jgi:hypothetical protein
LRAEPGSTGRIVTNKLTAETAAVIDMPGWDIVAVAEPMHLGDFAKANGNFLSLRDELKVGTEAQLTGRFCGDKINLSDRVTVS